MNTCKEFKIATISDIHIGHGRLSPSAVYEHLHIYLQPIFKDIKLLVFNGDLFDTLLTLNGESGKYAGLFIDTVINWAIEYKVYIRVVRGTFSHDRHQNQFFLVKDAGIHTINDIPLVRVLDRMTIEHFDDMNINVLYCPDNQPHKDLSQAVVDIIQANGLSKVDLLFSHGYFDHLLPRGIPHIPTNTLYLDKLDKYVSGLILNGHVHKASVYKNKVISLGSFERFEHDNERPVGMWLLSANREKHILKWNYKFIENELTMRFITYVVEKYKTPEELMSAISTYVSSVVQDYADMGRDWCDTPIYIRLIGNITGISEWIKSTYKNVYVTEQSTSNKQDISIAEIESTSDELPLITEDNLAQLVYDNLATDDITYEDVKEILDEL